MLVLGMFAQTSQAAFVNGVAFLIPTLRDDRGLDLTRSGVIVAAPTLGVVFTMIAWGATADRYGERLVLTLGMIATAVAGACAALTQSLPVLWLFLFLGGAAAASANAASGRVVVGWFPPQRRGLAMGIRQMSIPLGIAITALTMPALAGTYGIGAALAVPTIMCAIAAAACGFGVRNPPRPSRTSAEGTALLANPYRRTSSLARIHAASALLVVPQYTVWTFALVWLMT
ncbi:MAG: MFS transporter, partial [Rhodococcus sp.]|nr:MFS transporter [Rhodococcus sp. (in: high G+C Gram-positive bacteria)]